MSSLVQFTKPYYTVNVFISGLYLLTRKLVLTSIEHDDRDYLLKRENEAFFFFLVIVGFKLFRNRSIEAIAKSFFVSSQLVNAILFSVASTYMGGAYVALFLVNLVLNQQPAYSASTNIHGFVLLNDFFRHVVDDFNTNKAALDAKKQDSIWVLELYDAWDPASNYFSDMFTLLASKFKATHIQFAKVDINKNVAEAKKLEIKKRDVPAILIFKNRSLVTTLNKQALFPNDLKPCLENNRAIYNKLVDNSKLLDYIGIKE